VIEAEIRIGKINSKIFVGIGLVKKVVKKKIRKSKLDFWKKSWIEPKKEKKLKKPKNWKSWIELKKLENRIWFLTLVSLMVFCQNTNIKNELIFTYFCLKVKIEMKSLSGICCSAVISSLPVICFGLLMGLAGILLITLILLLG